MDTLDLNGTWQLAWSDDLRGHAGHMERDNPDGCFCIDAQVPGEVHLDLKRAGLIGDVHLGLNALQARWVEENRWATGASSSSRRKPRERTPGWCSRDPTSRRASCSTAGRPGATTTRSSPAA